MAQGIILAGGFSSRIGQNKMSLIYQGKPLIHHCIQAMMPFVSEIIVVSGHYHDELIQLLKNMDDVTVIYNENYPYGMFSSVKKGALHIHEDFFILPGDYPLVQSSTYEKLLKTQKQIAVPSYSQSRGHPLFIKKELIQALKDEPINSNLKLFRNRYEIDDVVVDDEGVLLDIDTLQDLEKLIQKELK